MYMLSLPLPQTKPTCVPFLFLKPGRRKSGPCTCPPPLYSSSQACCQCCDVPVDTNDALGSCCPLLRASADTITGSESNSGCLLTDRAAALTPSLEEMPALPLPLPAPGAPSLELQRSSSGSTLPGMDVEMRCGVYGMGGV